MPANMQRFDPNYYQQSMYGGNFPMNTLDQFSNQNFTMQNNPWGMTGGQSDQLQQ
jgi:hypothetical protein